MSECIRCGKPIQAAIVFPGQQVHCLNCGQDQYVVHRDVQAVVRDAITGIQSARLGEVRQDDTGARPWTPGPWEVDLVCDDHHDTYAIEGDSLNRQDANRLLISTAPELFEGLDWLMAHFDTMSVCIAGCVPAAPCRYCQIRSTLAKALGK